MDSNSPSILFYIGIILFFAGPIFYAIMYARYRNKGARDYYERETPTQMSNLQVYDTFVRRDTDQRSSRISGVNSNRVNGTLEAYNKRQGK